MQFHEEAHYPLRAARSRESTLYCQPELVAAVHGMALYVDIVLLFEARPPHIPSMFLMVNTTHLAAFASGMSRSFK